MASIADSEIVLSMVNILKALKVALQTLYNYDFLLTKTLEVHQLRFPELSQFTSTHGTFEIENTGYLGSSGKK